MFKSIVLGFMVFVGLYGNNETVTSENVNNDNIQLDIFYMYSNDDGTYWIEPTTENENVIYVGYDDLKEWNVNADSLHHGEKFVGTFDNAGWELYGLESVR